ncbi:lysis protein [Pseudomonas sp. zfem002]|uniref:lysis protein n=1 Tax=Pseudomonas sp. zfem002 TaxID=3078197 RepID=UPI00397787DF
MSRLRIAALALLVLATCALTWQVQEWRHDRQVALREEAYARERQRLAEIATTQLQDERQQRLALEQRLQAVDQTHYQELIDAQQTQARLRDRLATSDLRLSVLLANLAAGGDGGLPAGARAGGVVHGTARVQLDPAHAQRIIGITGDGDQGLIALRACQAYVRGIAR